MRPDSELASYDGSYPPTLDYEKEGGNYRGVAKYRNHPVWVGAATLVIRAEYLLEHGIEGPTVWFERELKDNAGEIVGRARFDVDPAKGETVLIGNAVTRISKRMI